MGLDLRSSTSTERTTSLSLKTIIFWALFAYSAYMTGLRMFDMGYNDGVKTGYDAGLNQGFEKGKAEACMVKPV